MTPDELDRIGSMKPEELRRCLASLLGILARVHGHLRLSGQTPADRLTALEAWCAARRAEKEQQQA